MAFTERLPSGRYRGGYWGTVDGRPKKIWTPGTYGRRSDAKAKAEDAASTARRQAPAKTGPLPAATTWGDWWDILAAQRNFESDVAATEASIVTAQLRPHWGDTPLNTIDAVAIQDWVDSYARRRTPKGHHYSPSYVRRVYGVLSLSLRAAVKKKILPSSPTEGVVLPRVPRRAKSYLSLPEASRLVDQFRAPRKSGRSAPLDDYADVVDFGLETGLRPGELAGLHSDQVDRDTRILTVSTVYVRRRKTMRGHPKDEDEREIPLTGKAWEIFERRVAPLVMGQPCGVPHFDGDCRSDLVFRTRMGRVLNTDALWRSMRKASLEAGIPIRTPYSLRRGFTTRLREGGADVFTIMELMGHATVQQSHGYAQQGPEFDSRVRAVLGDPAESGLRVVGQHGKSHGTDPGGTALEDTGPDRDWMHS